MIGLETSCAPSSFPSVEGATMNWAKLEKQLRKSKDEWQFKVYKLIRTNIKKGHVITYGGLAERANSKYGLNIISRNTAWLRDILYESIENESDVRQLPLHRIAKKGYSTSDWDSEVTRKRNKLFRTAVVSLPE